MVPLSPEPVISQELDQTEGPGETTSPSPEAAQEPQANAGNEQDQDACADVPADASLQGAWVEFGGTLSDLEDRPDDTHNGRSKTPTHDAEAVSLSSYPSNQLC